MDYGYLDLETPLYNQEIEGYSGPYWQDKQSHKLGSRDWESLLEHLGRAEEAFKELSPQEIDPMGAYDMGSVGEVIHQLRHTIVPLLRQKTEGHEDMKLSLNWCRCAPVRQKWIMGPAFIELSIQRKKEGPVTIYRQEFSPRYSKGVVAKAIEAIATLA